MTLPLAAAALMLALAGCSAAEDAANDAADAAADRARQEATNALRDAIQGQVCNLVGDNRLTDTDITAVSAWLARQAAPHDPSPESSNLVRMPFACGSQQ